MIAEIIPEAYDAVGKQVSQPFSRRKGPHSTFPMGRYISKPLSVRCQNIGDVRNFLLGCKYVSDQELFGKRDYWQPPEDFEKQKKGDCEDFALWTWRQLLSMGYDARFIGGSAGRYGAGHAWVEYFQDGKCFLLEPQRCRVGYTMPRLATLRYEPRFSVAWDGKTLRYFAHKKPVTGPKLSAFLPLVPEYLVFWTWIWLMVLFRAPQIMWNVLRMRVFKRELWGLRKSRSS
ncbi:MAG TPA: transglutaminase-like cysteine peptidase [Candidatus Sulfotelmatobacter sp.]|nr:transglutaminase-like cysteine peptidase [Candidatus Sulfotelmatobacter sp.]